MNQGASGGFNKTDTDPGFRAESGNKFLRFFKRLHPGAKLEKPRVEVKERTRAVREVFRHQGRRLKAAAKSRSLS